MNLRRKHMVSLYKGMLKYGAKTDYQVTTKPFGEGIGIGISYNDDNSYVPAKTLCIILKPNEEL